MKIKGCCIQFLKDWDGMTVYHVSELILLCEHCKQEWKMERFVRKRADYLNVSWIKIKKSKEDK